MRRQPTPREMLVALHAARDLPRRSACRLAAEVVAGSARPGGAPPVSWPDAERIIAAAGAELEAAAALEARIVTALDADFPAVLLALDLPPPALVVRGTLPPGPAVAIVGSRLADGYGCEAARLFALFLASEGVVVISGLARGIDAAAHQGALAAGGGITVGILGCGMGVDYPRGHARLAAAVAERGALVSEFPCGAGPRRWHFPERNRTVAALAGATLVVQATPRSGSLVTARHAGDLGRAVFAVPGPVFAPLSWGPHALIAAGARLASHPHDILEELARGAAAAGPGATAEEAGEEEDGRRRERADGGADAAALDGAAAPRTRDAAHLEEKERNESHESHARDEGDGADGLSNGTSRGRKGMSGAHNGPPAPPPPLPAAHRAVLAGLRVRTVRSAEQVAAAAGLAPATVLAALLELEVGRRVERLPGMVYRLARGRSAPHGEGRRT
jgi:DNA processing protein